MNCQPNKQFNTYKEGLDLEFLREYCIEHGEMRIFHRAEVLVREGEKSRWLGYVAKGCFKYTINNKTENRDYITGFAFENEFVGDFPNCINKRESLVSIVAITSSEVYMIDGQQLQLLLENRNLALIYKYLFQQIYTQYLDSYRMTVRERYRNLLYRCPQIVHQINLKDIASFLRVTPTTISNIRREITFEQ
jgi:CRP-like cAMP-binding protein